MSRKDFQNGFALGVVSGGAVVETAPNPLGYGTTLKDVYSGVAFPVGYELTINMLYLRSIYYGFYNSRGLRKVTIKGNIAENALNLNQAFRNSNALEIVDFSELRVLIGTCDYTFSNVRTLREILGVLDFSTTTSNNSVFQNCDNLETVTIKADTLKKSISFAQSPKLTAQSVKSIIAGIAPVETAQTITFNSSIVLTDEQKATINAKGWTLVQ